MIRMIRIRCFLIVVAAIALLQNIAVAQTLAERLAPPQKCDVPALAGVETPRPRAVRGADKVPAHLWGLPFGAFPGSPTILTPEQTRGAWARPAVDAPQLAAEHDPARPAYPALPQGPKSLVSSVNPQVAAVLGRFAMPLEPAARPSDNPAALPAYLLITGPVPLAAANPAPLLRLAIPDPFEHLRAIRLPQPPTDADTLEAPRDRPPLPKLPEPTPAK